MTLAEDEPQPDVTRESQPRHDCPGLSAYVSWDDEASLRGEILPSERLTEHAAEIALAHGSPSLGGSSRPLRQRFVAAQSKIRDAYATLVRNAELGRERSPAEEWLIDNSHVVADQIREVREDLPWGYLRKLPRIAQGVMRGFPRVYGLCLDYLRHTDARVDLATLVAYVQSYQNQSLLTIGELWAVPIMLRLGLILTVGGVAISAAGADDLAKAQVLAERLIENSSQPLRVKAALMELDRRSQSPSPAFLVELLKRLRDHDVPLGIVTEWVKIQCERLGTNPAELVRRQHLRLSADQVSVANAITSMTSITALNWNDFFEQTSAVEAILREDPASAYAVSDEISRDRCRHVVEAIARRGVLREVEVAKVALQLARAAAQKSAADVAEGHIGYYLVDQGRREVEAISEYRVPLRQRVGRMVRRHPASVYFGSIAVLSLALCVIGVSWLIDANAAAALRLLVALLMAIPVSEIAISVVNSVVVAVLPPRLLQKIEFKAEIPKEFRTLVVVPVIIDGPKTVDSLLEDLEVRSLANPDQGLQFALLSDFVDAKEETAPTDAALLMQIRKGILRLNERYASSGEARYLLLHRRRLWNAAEGCWMGWERKRGKLEELNRLLRGAADTSFMETSVDPTSLLSVRYVITLDADTELPRDVARKLIGTLAHPLNRPRCDPRTRRVVAGHGIIQPRVGSLPVSTRKSRFARIFSGTTGIDPYTTAVSDVYQDLFGEGSYVGKGIYDVDALLQALDARVPENQMLSHDLFEGIYARAALATDIEVLDDQPASYGVLTDRQQR
ncbi:MAG TPA: protein ndvB, partial [Polyangiaceae bacterium]